MADWTRRGMLASTSASFITACSGGTASQARFRIDANVEAAIRQMEREIPVARNLLQTTAGLLVIPKVTKAGLVVGAAYGEGSLLIGRAPIDYYSVVAGSFGFQIGVQQVSQALFFIDSASLQHFRTQPGWTLGADLEFTAIDDAKAASLDTNTVHKGIYGIVFGQSGFLAGASLEGSKYNRIVR